MLNRNLYFGYDISDNTIHDRYNDIIHCVLIGVLIFTAAYGCITGILSEFDISVNYVVLFLVMLASSVFLSLIHISKLLYNGGYIAFLFTFTYALITFRSYANSGFQALLNIINEIYSDYYLLSSIREYTEIITDRYLTITAVSIFLGIFLVLLLNVDVFNNMYFGTVFGLTFVPLQLGFFIGRYPSYFSLVLLFLSYFGIYLLRHSGHFFFVQPPRRNKPREYSFDYDDKAGRHTVFHKSNARSMTMLSLFALVISLIFSIFTASSVTTSESEAILKKSSSRKKLDESVKILTQTGLAGMFNRYQAKGGISGGKLGGVRSVSPDYETDLEVTFVPYSFETLYLKGYTGQQYTGFQWNAPSEDTGYELNMQTGSYTQSLSRQELATHRILLESNTAYRLMNKGVFDKGTARMTVKNIDASTGYIYIPYFLSSVPSKATVEPYSYYKGFSSIDGEETYEFTPYSSSMSDIIFGNSEVLYDTYSEEELSELKEYETEIYKNYLQIPDEIYDELMSYHKEIGTDESVSGQINLIYRYFLDNYTYDMAPGATPYNRDFVTYFLKDQKRGYCAHFASAGAMLLRSYGIPARYVEGYVVTPTGISETGEAKEEDKSYYFTGINPIKESAVITTEITDGDAHAWVEVYIRGFGWFPVEFTVPDTGEASAGYGDFLSALGRFFRPDEMPDPSDQSTDIETPDIDPASFLNLGGTPAFMIFVWILVLLMLIPLFKRAYKAFIRYNRQRRSYKNGDYSPSVVYRYERASAKLRRLLSDDRPGLVSNTFLLIAGILRGHTGAINMVSGVQDTSDRPVYGSDLVPDSMTSKPNRHSLRGLSVIKKHLTEKAMLKIRRHITESVDKENTNLDALCLMTQECFYSNKKPDKQTADLLIRFYKAI
ncbi:MAG: transglutaminase-like domain-containing protein [Lachnospiraceae bacterium]|nr:transglutaminase-like domain-containing protein [Lachnospiraceae bacterium]